MASSHEEIEDKVLANIRSAVVDDIARTLRVLLETKQLYQGVKLELTDASAEAKRLQKMVNETGGANALWRFGGKQVWSTHLEPHLISYASEVASESWNVVPELRSRSSKLVDAPIEITAPPVEIYCRRCKDKKAHNSGSLEIETVCPAYPLGAKNEQVFTCGYECQVCRTSPVVFQITRRGDKLTTTGCSDYPKVSVARVIPEEIKDHISDAIVAKATGRILAALFFLRTAVEQHMRQVTELSGRQTGDELAAAYYPLLNEKLPKHEWVLGKIYGELSDKLHAANADGAQFDKSLGDLERFFQLASLYPLKAHTSTQSRQ